VKLITLTLVFMVSGCAYSIKEVDTKGRDSGCIRQCASVYSGCVSSTHQIGSKFETLRACREGYSVCVNTCPAI
jgi:hypothetical protein